MAAGGCAFFFFYYLVRLRSIRPCKINNSYLWPLMGTVRYRRIIPRHQRPILVLVRVRTVAVARLLQEAHVAERVYTAAEIPAKIRREAYSSFGIAAGKCCYISKPMQAIIIDRRFSWRCRDKMTGCRRILAYRLALYLLLAAWFVAAAHHLIYYYEYQRHTNNSAPSLRLRGLRVDISGSIPSSLSVSGERDENNSDCLIERILDVPTNVITNAVEAVPPWCLEMITKKVSHDFHQKYREALLTPLLAHLEVIFRFGMSPAIALLRWHHH